MLEFLHENYQHFLYGLVLLFFIAASYTDIKKMEIPIGFCIFNIGFALFIYINFKIPMFYYAITAIVLGVIYLLYALFVTGSGGDVYMMTMLGFCVGAFGSCISIIISGITLFIYWLITRIKFGKKAVKKKEFPLAPFVGGGYIAFIILVYIGFVNPLF